MTTVTTYELPPLDPGTASVAYELANFPTPPWCLTRSRSDDSEDRARCAEWLNETAMADRLPVIEHVLDRLGAPKVDSSDPDPGLAALGQWLQEWFPKVAEPFVQTGYPSVPGWRHNFLVPTGEDRLGNVSSWSWPRMQGYSALGDALLHSLVVDLASIIMSCALTRDPQLRWTSQFGHFHLVLHTSEPLFAPLEQIRELLVQSVGPPRGERGRSLRRRQSRILVDCYSQAVTGIAPESIENQFHEQRHRMLSRFKVKRPGRAAPEPPQNLVDAVSRLRSIGLYEKWKYTDVALAQALSSGWLHATGRTLPGDQEQLWLCLILMDGDRTWFEDVDMAIQGVGDRMYFLTLFSLESIGGRGFGGFSDPEEDWDAEPGSVIVTVRWRRKKHRFTIPVTPDGVLHPKLFTELNAFLPDDGPRLWFADRGPTVGIVVRATDGERDALCELTGISLSEEPPEWWVRASNEGVASLGLADGFDPLLMGESGRQVPVEDAERGVMSIEGPDLRGVSVTDYELDGQVVFSVFVSAAEFLRGDTLERELDHQIQTALRSVPGVVDVTHEDREVWLVFGDPDEGALVEAASAAVETVLQEHADEIPRS